MLLQWSDSAFPTGAFAHSGGLETYAQVEVVRSADEVGRVAAEIEQSLQPLPVTSDEEE